MSIENYKGTWLIDFRKWFQADDGQLHVTTSKGIKIGVKHLRSISAAMDKALEAARSRGLITPDEPPVPV